MYQALATLPKCINKSYFFSEIMSQTSTEIIPSDRMPFFDLGTKQLNLNKLGTHCRGGQGIYEAEWRGGQSIFEAEQRGGGQSKNEGICIARPH